MKTTQFYNIKRVYLHLYTVSIMPTQLVNVTLMTIKRYQLKSMYFQIAFNCSISQNCYYLKIVNHQKPFRYLFKNVYLKKDGNCNLWTINN